MGKLGDRIGALDWGRLRAELDERGYAVAPRVLRAGEANGLIGLFDDGDFRSVIDMRRHRFGSGVYMYFDYPLPGPVQELRVAFYRLLAEQANAWAERLGEPRRYPSDLDGFLDLCHDAGQERPTPLIF